MIGQTLCASMTRVTAGTRCGTGQRRPAFAPAGTGTSSPMLSPSWVRGATVRGFGDLEAAIMDRLWARSGPATVRDLLDDLAPVRAPAYTTVLTVVDNLYKKGWLRREPVGRAFRYAPTISRAEYGARQLRHALDDAGDPAEALVRFVGKMNDSETAALRQALAAYEDEADGQ